MGSSRTRGQTCVPCTGRWILNHCTTREAQQRYLNVRIKIGFYSSDEIIESEDQTIKDPSGVSADILLAGVLLTPAGLLGGPAGLTMNPL